MIPSFFILAFAQSKIVLWIGLILFSIGSNKTSVVLTNRKLIFVSASSIVVNVINSFASKAGASRFLSSIETENFSFSGLCSEKGTILGIFRSLQALARAIGPLIASFCKKIGFRFGQRKTNLSFSFSLLVDRREEHLFDRLSFIVLSFIDDHSSRTTTQMNRTIFLRFLFRRSLFE